MTAKTAKSKSATAKDTVAKKQAKPSTATKPAASREAKSPPATAKPAATQVEKPRPKDEPEPPVSEAKVDAPLPTGLGVPQQRGFDGATLTRIWVGAATVTIALTVILGTVYGPPTGVLVLVTATFTAVIALFWSSLRTVLGETVLQSADAFAIGALHGEDEQKRAVLRALKDLEFERSVGKISEDDYKVLVVKLRARAKELLRQLDEAGSAQRARAELLVEERSRALLAAAKAATAKAEEDDETDAEEDGVDEDAKPADDAKPTEEAKPAEDAKSDKNEDDVEDEGDDAEEDDVEEARDVREEKRS